MARPIMVVTDSISSTTRKDSARSACSAEVKLQRKLGRGVELTERDSIVRVEDTTGRAKLSTVDIVL